MSCATIGLAPRTAAASALVSAAAPFFTRLALPLLLLAAVVVAVAAAVAAARFFALLLRIGKQPVVSGMTSAVGSVCAAKFDSGGFHSTNLCSRHQVHRHAAAVAAAVQCAQESFSKLRASTQHRPYAKLLGLLKSCANMLYEHVCCRICYTLKHNLKCRCTGLANELMLLDTA